MSSGIERSLQYFLNLDNETYCIHGENGYSIFPGDFCIFHLVGTFLKREESSKSNFRTRRSLWSGI